MLYDGWPLVYAPGSPAALHLFEILSALPAGVEPRAALPFAGEPEQIRAMFGSTPVGFEGREDGVRPVFVPTPDTAGGRLRWQQWILPSLVRRVGAKLVHTTGPLPPLFSSVPVILSPTGGVEDSRSDETFAGRLGDALGRGGLSGVQAVLWPGDLPASPAADPLVPISPFVHPAFMIDHPGLEGLPERYVLAAGPLDAPALDLLAAAWSWAQGGLGEDWALLVYDVDAPGVEHLRRLCQQAGVTGRVEWFAAGTPQQRAALFQHAEAVLALGPVLPWADALLHALACGRPLIAEESPLADARAGPAAYLTPRGDARALGAALITVIVEEAVGEQLGQMARQRASTWNVDAFRRGLAAVYGIKNEAGLA